MSTSPQPHATFSPSSHALRHKRLRHNVRGAGAQSAHHAGAQSAPPPISVLASAPSRPRSLARLGLSAWPRCFSSSPHPLRLTRPPAGRRPLALSSSLLRSLTSCLSLPVSHSPLHSIPRADVACLRSKQQRNTHQATEKHSSSNRETLIKQKRNTHQATEKHSSSNRETLIKQQRNQQQSSFRGRQSTASAPALASALYLSLALSLTPSVSHALVARMGGRRDLPSALACKSCVAREDSARRDALAVLAGGEGEGEQLEEHVVVRKLVIEPSPKRPQHYHLPCTSMSPPHTCQHPHVRLHKDT
jgi:hypothetical protein